MLKYDFRKRRLTFAQGTNLNQRILLEDEPDEPGLDAGRLGPHEQAIDDVINTAGQEEGDHLQVDVELFYLD